MLMSFFACVHGRPCLCTQQYMHLLPRGGAAARLGIAAAATVIPACLPGLLWLLLWRWRQPAAQVGHEVGRHLFKGCVPARLTLFYCRHSRDQLGGGLGSCI